MSRTKKSKKSGLMWIAVICIIVFAVAFYGMQNSAQKPNTNENSTNTTEEITNNVEENIVSNESENEASENTANNEIAQNTVDNTEEKTENSNTTKPQTAKPNNTGVTDKKQKAIELVKNEWGKEDETVNYVFDYVNENGEYVIAVKDRDSATVKCYFRVNLETETVELD